MGCQYDLTDALTVEMRRQSVYIFADGECIELGNDEMHLLADWLAVNRDKIRTPSRKTSAVPKEE